MILLPLAVTIRDLVLIALLAALIVAVVALAWAGRQPRSSLRDQALALVRLPLVLIAAVVPALLCAVGIWLTVTVASLFLTPTLRPAPPALQRPREVPAHFTDRTHSAVLGSITETEGVRC